MRRSIAALLAASLLGVLVVSPVFALTATTTGLIVYNVDVSGDLTPGFVRAKVTVSPRPTAPTAMTITDDLDASVAVSFTYPTLAASVDVDLLAALAAGPHQLRTAFPGDGVLDASTGPAFSFTLLAPTTTTASITELGGGDYRVDVLVSPAPAAGTPYTVTEGVGNVRAGDVLAADGTGSAQVSFADGASHTLQVRVATDHSDGLAGSTSGNLVARGSLSTFLLYSGSGTATVGYPLTVFACIVTPSFGWDGINDSVVVREVGSDTALAQDREADGPGPCDLSASQFTFAFDVTSLPVGAHTLVAYFAGDAKTSPALSNTIDVTVTADTQVDLRTYSSSPARFYPVKDGYRDTTALRWSAGENLSETTDVYNSAGKRVVRLGTKTGTTGGAVTWNGRNSAGTLLAAGTYRFRTTFRDVQGHILVKTTSVTLSHKRLYTVSSTYYRNGEDYSYSQRDGAGLVLRSESHWSTGVWLDSGQDSYGGNQARAFYRFRLPSAITYKTLAWSVLGRNYAGRATSGIWQYTSSWYDPERQVYSGYAWTPLSAPASTRVSGGYATGVVVANGYYNSLFDVRQVRLRVTYTVLR